MNLSWCSMPSQNWWNDKYLSHKGGILYQEWLLNGFGKRPLAIAAMNAELPPFKNGKHNSESVSPLTVT